MNVPSETDALFILGKDLSIVRTQKVLNKTESRMSPFSMRNSLAGAKIVQQGYEGALVFVSGPTWCEESEAIRMERAFKVFLGETASKITNKIIRIEDTIDTKEDIDASLRLINEIGFEHPAFLSCASHRFAIEKLLTERGKRTPLLTAESYLSKAEMKELRDWRVPLENASEAIVGRFLPPNLRSGLAAWQRRRPGERK